MKFDQWLRSSILAFALAAAPLTGAEAQQPAARYSPGFSGMNDQNGQTVAARTFANKNQVVYFGMAGCGTSCPTALAKMKQAFEILEHNGYGPKLENTVPVFVTIQATDQPKDMKSYLSAMPSPKNMLGLSSFLNQDAIDRAEKAFAVVVPKDNKLGHSNAIYFVDTNNRIYWLDSGTPQELANSLAQRLNAQPNPLAVPHAGRN